MNDLMDLADTRDFSKKLDMLIAELEGIHKSILEKGSETEALANVVHQSYRLSAINLFQYLVFRSFDLRRYHDVLSELGLSSLRTSESYVMSNLHSVLSILKNMKGKAFKQGPNGDFPGFRKGQELLLDHTNALFGQKAKRHDTKIMVTLPTEAATDLQLIMDMVTTGMEIARINLGHDDEDIWRAMVEKIRTVEKKTGKSIKIYMDLAGPKIRTASISILGKKGKLKNSIPVQNGEHIVLTKSVTSEKKSLFDIRGRQLEKAVIGVTLPQVIDDLGIGDVVLFDDGMIRSKVVSKGVDEVELLLTQCFKSKIGASKGINLPHTKLRLPALTDDDLEVLPFACRYADILGYSFVRNESDVAILYQELDKLKADKVGVVFKIENQEAFENFPNILLKGMERNKIGVMIARGDLAVELGFERISEVQMELLWICEAAHIPVIWATQVLETLAKKGIPTRAEISDAAQGARAECVMLNKGPHILEAISILRNILDKMDAHMAKKKESLRALNIAKNYIQ